MASRICGLSFRRIHDQCNFWPYGCADLTHWAKLFTMMQILISLTIMVLLISRAVGVLLNAPLLLKGARIAPSPNLQLERSEVNVSGNDVVSRCGAARAARTGR